MRTRLQEIIREKSFSNDREITLASGRKSFIYFNLKPTMMHAEGAHLLSELLAETIFELQEKRGSDYVGGMEIGGVPLVALASAATFRQRPSKAIPALFIRKAAKSHGTQQRVEGLAPGESLQGKRVIMLEDVTTTGGSIADAIEVVRNEQALCEDVLTVVDREEGAKEALWRKGVQLSSLFRASDFSN